MYALLHWTCRGNIADSVVGFAGHSDHIACIMREKGTPGWAAINTGLTSMAANSPICMMAHVHRTLYLTNALPVPSESLIVLLGRYQFQPCMTQLGLEFEGWHCWQSAAGAGLQAQHVLRAHMMPPPASVRCRCRPGAGQCTLPVLVDRLGM